MYTSSELEIKILDLDSGSVTWIFLEFAIAGEIIVVTTCKALDLDSGSL